MLDLREVAGGRLLLPLRPAAGPAEDHRGGPHLQARLKYSEPWGCRRAQRRRREVVPLMGSYGIGIERILCAVIETFHDQDGMILPPAIAPFQAVVTPANIADEAHAEPRVPSTASVWLWASIHLARRPRRAPGVKFKDADLIGVPFRVTVGRKLAGGMWNWWTARSANRWTSRWRMRRARLKKGSDPFFSGTADISAMDTAGESAVALSY